MNVNGEENCKRKERSCTPRRKKKKNTRRDNYEELNQYYEFSESTTPISQTQTSLNTPKFNVALTDSHSD